MERPANKWIPSNSHCYTRDLNLVNYNARPISETTQTWETTVSLYYHSKNGVLKRIVGILCLNLQYHSMGPRNLIPTSISPCPQPDIQNSGRAWGFTNTTAAEQEQFALFCLWLQKLEWLNDLWYVWWPRLRMTCNIEIRDTQKHEFKFQRFDANASMQLEALHVKPWAHSCLNGENDHTQILHSKIDNPIFQLFVEDKINKNFFKIILGHTRDSKKVCFRIII